MASQKAPEKGIMVDGECICPEPDAKASKPPKVECPPEYPVCPPDPRFPNANQTRHCFCSFVDYQRCARLLGDYPGCKIFYTCYTSLCPHDWTEKWFDQMEAGIFPKKIYPPKPIVRPDPEKMKTICLEEQYEPPEKPDNVC